MIGATDAGNSLSPSSTLVTCFSTGLRRRSDALGIPRHTMAIRQAATRAQVTAYTR